MSEGKLLFRISSDGTSIVSSPVVKSWNLSVGNKVSVHVQNQSDQSEPIRHPMGIRAVCR